MTNSFDKCQLYGFNKDIEDNIHFTLVTLDSMYYKLQANHRKPTYVII